MLRMVFVLILLTSCAGGGGLSSPQDTGMDTTLDVLADVAPDVGPDVAPDSAPDVAMDAGPPEPVEHGGVTAEQIDDELVLSNGIVEIRYRLDAGTWDVLGPEGGAQILDAEARVVMDDGTFEGLVHGTAGLAAAGWEANPADDELGAGVQVMIEIPGGPGVDTGPDFRLEFGMRGGETFILSRVFGVWPEEGAADLRVRDTVPLVADGRTGGALFLGADPWKHVVLDNGADMYFDFASRVYRFGQGGSVFFPPGSVSNWNMALVDSESDRSLVAGYLSFDKAIGLIRLHYEPALATELDGRTGFTRFEAFGRLEPPVPPPSGSDRFGAGTRTLPSELFYLDVAPTTPFDGLEEWAAAYAAWHGKTVWTEVPTGWNSWGGGGGSGGMGTDIDEPMMLENLAAMTEDLTPFGMSHFLLDDGWQLDHGDWETNPEFFPSHDGQDGLHWLADQIYAAGATPGIWIAPFWVHTNAQLATDHSDWLAPISEFGYFLMNPEHDAILDLSNPEVLAHIHEIFTKITQDWGYKWIKMDFAYYALFPETLYNPEKTASEAFHDALAVIRDAIGPDTFFLTISAMGLCMDTADGSRLTLDNEPVWGDIEDQGIKVTLRTAAHRYYLSKLWVNHPDLVFYRPDPYGLTLGEARAWTSMVALLGGIVKLGETYTDMHDHPEWLTLLRPVLPVYAATARPLDLFEWHYPEIWILPVEREGRSWHVAGLFNWGINEHVVTGEEVGDEPREKTLDWSMLGMDPGQKLLLFDAWEQTCEWADGPAWTVTVPPRSERLFVVRPEPAAPMVVFTSRHLMGGAVEVSDETVETVVGDAVLAFDLANPAGHEVTAFVAGGGVAAQEVLAPEGAVLTAGPCEGVWAVTFTPDKDVTHVEVRF